MRLFSKKKKEEEQERQKPVESLNLPELPKLPEFPDIEEDTSYRLPTFPQNSLGKKFSQASIKDAVIGKKNYEDISEKPIRRTSKEVLLAEEEKETPEEFKETSKTIVGIEPIFIRIDKFEESLNLFGKIKKQISEIEKMLENIKTLKQKEGAELASWEDEVLLIKKQIERIDQDIFSKIE